MPYKNWIDWSQKAGKIKHKYDNNKRLIFNELKNLKPKLLRTYKPKDALVLLFLAYKLIRSQELLYKRYVNVFM